MSYTNCIRAEAGLVRVMSSNTLAWPPGKSSLIPTPDRARALCAHYIAYQPDLLGLQEVQADTMEIITKALSELYAPVPVDTEGRANYTPLFYKKDAFTLLDSRFVSFFPNDPGSLWDYEWALYERKSDGRRMIHMNLHYHFSTSEERAREARLVNAEIRRLLSLYPDAPIFVTGDYNSETFTPEFAAMIEDLPVNSGMLLCEDNDGYEVGWHHPDTGNYDGAGAIDHVSVSYERARVVRHRRLRSELLRYTTDHDPIFVDVDLDPLTKEG